MSREAHSGQLHQAGRPTVDSDAGRWVALALIALLVIEYLGLSYQYRWLSALKVPTLLAATLFLAALAQGDKRVLIASTQSKIILAIVGLTIASVFYAVVKTYAAQSITGIVGYFGLGVVAAYSINRSSRAIQLSTALSAIVIVLVFRNYDMLGDETRSGHFMAGYFLGDGNDFAWGLNVMLPFALFLATTHVSMWRRLLGAGAAVAALLGIIGTASRGGTVALAATMFFYWIVISKRKAAGLLLVVLVAAGILLFAPAAYLHRMETIATYSEDSSATSRILAWKAATQMALDYPLGVGAGSFNSAYGRYYMPDEARTARWMSAHSVYFKTLGEYGFPGLALLLALLWVNVRQALICGRQDLPEPTVFPAAWPKFLAMAVVGYAAGGLFLGGIFYPHLFLVSGLIIACYHRMVLQAPIAVMTDPAPAAQPRTFPRAASRLIVERKHPGIAQHSSGSAAKLQRSGSALH